MKKQFLIFALFFISTHYAVAEQLATSGIQLNALYQIVQVNEQGQKISRTMTLYRTENQVGQYFHDKGYGDWWSKNSSSKIMLLRYFPKYQQSIEYQQDEIQGVKHQADFWQKKNQLVSLEFLSKMTVENVEKREGNIIEVMSYRDKSQTIHVRWIANLKLLERLDIYSGNMLVSSWTLNYFSTDPEQIATYTRTIQSYQSTDYADIGDNESNSFLTKMIHQGFTERRVIIGDNSNSKEQSRDHHQGH